MGVEGGDQIKRGTLAMLEVVAVGQGGVKAVQGPLQVNKIGIPPIAYCQEMVPLE